MTAGLSSSSSHSEGKGADPQSADATASSVSSSTEMHASSRFVQSRVGRTNQRYDGTTRLLACVVVLRPATRKRPAPPPHSSSASDAAEKDKQEVEKDEQEVLVITSSKHPNEWIIPKGGWENDESVQECALREVEEEAGIAGLLQEELGPLDFLSKQGKPCRFYGFRMEARQEFRAWAEQNRERKWVSIAEGRQLLQHRPELLEMLMRTQSQ